VPPGCRREVSGNWSGIGKSRGVNEFEGGGIGLGQGIAPQPFGKKVEDVG